MVNDNVINPAAAQMILGSFDEQIFHHHIGATPCNVSILKRYEEESRVVITQRNVLDTLVSLREYLEKPEVRDAWDAGPGCSGGQWCALPEDQKMKWIAYNSTPWYFSFFVQWQSAKVNKLVVKYEEFFEDQLDGVRKILDFVGIDQGGYSDQHISEIAGHRDGKYNVGRSGRGKEMIPQEMIDVIYDHADSWGPYWSKRIKEELLD